MIVIASRGGVYDLLIKYYWIPFICYVRNNENINKDLLIYLVFGKDSTTTDLNKISNNIIVAPSTESLEKIYHKTIYAFSIINKNHKYDYIFRTNLSSFIILPYFEKIVESLPLSNVYSGNFVVGEERIASGAGFFLSKDLVEYCINNIQVHDKYDDVNFSIILKHVDIIGQKRLDIVECKSFRIEDMEDLYQFIVNSDKCFHIRLKNPNRNVDVQLAKFLTKKFYS